MGRRTPRSQGWWHPALRELRVPRVVLAWGRETFPLHPESSTIQATEMLPAALPGSLSLSWPQLSAGRLWCGAASGFPSGSRMGLLAAHRILDFAPALVPGDGPVLPLNPVLLVCGQRRMAPSGQRQEEGLNNCCLSVCLLSLQEGAGCSLLSSSLQRVARWGAAWLENEVKSYRPALTHGSLAVAGLGSGTCVLLFAGHIICILGSTGLEVRTWKEVTPLLWSWKAASICESPTLLPFSLLPASSIVFWAWGWLLWHC